MLSIVGVVFLALVAVAAAGVVAATRSHGRPGLWLGVAALATVVVYVYGAAKSLGSDTSTASWASTVMALFVVIGLVLLVVGRSRKSTAVSALSAAAIALGVASVIVTATAG